MPGGHRNLKVQPKTKGRHLTEPNVKVLKRLMTGKYLQSSISQKTAAQLAKETGVLDPYSVVSKCQDLGIIIGYVPVLSEEGHRIVAALELMYNMNDKGPTSEEDKTALEDLVR